MSVRGVVTWAAAAYARPATAIRFTATTNSVMLMRITT
jgi:hypothetical protein